MPSALPTLLPAGEGHQPMLDVDGGCQTTTNTTSTWMPVRSSSLMSERQGCVRSMVSDGVVLSSSPVHAAAADHSAGCHQPLDAQSQLSAAQLRTELEERQALMFKVDADALAASGRRAVLPFATQEAVQLGLGGGTHAVQS